MFGNGTKQVLLNLTSNTKEFGVEVISTGGTTKILESWVCLIVPIESYTVPEMMDGRVRLPRGMVVFHVVEMKIDHVAN